MPAHPRPEPIVVGPRLALSVLESRPLTVRCGKLEHNHRGASGKPTHDHLRCDRTRGANRRGCARCKRRPLRWRAARLLAAARPRRRTAHAHAGYLPILAHHGYSPFPMVQHRAGGRELRIYRNGTRASARLPDCDRDPPAALRRLLPGYAQPRGTVELAGAAGPHRARPLRGLPGAALPSHPHGLSWRALPPERIGLALCHLRRVLVDLDPVDAGACLPLRPVAARALQDAQYFLRRSAGTLRRLGFSPFPARLCPVAARGRAVLHRTRRNCARRRLEYAHGCAGRRRSLKLARGQRACRSSRLCRP